MNYIHFLSIYILYILCYIYHLISNIPYSKIFQFTEEFRFEFYFFSRKSRHCDLWHILFIFKYLLKFSLSIKIC